MSRQNRTLAAFAALNFILLAACGRTAPQGAPSPPAGDTNAVAASNISVTDIRIAPEVGFPGQRGLVMSVTLSNENEAAAVLEDIIPSFGSDTSQAYESIVAADLIGPSILPPASEVTWTLELSVDGAATAALLHARVVCWLRLGDGRLVEVQGSSPPGALQVQGDAPVRITEVRSALASVSAGDSPVSVDVVILHANNAPYALNAGGLRFLRGGRDISDAFSTTPRLPWPRALDATGAHTVSYWVAASATLTAGPVLVDATVTVAPADGVAWVLSGAETPLVWQTTADTSLEIVSVVASQDTLYPGQDGVLARIQVRNSSSATLVALRPHMSFHRGGETVTDALYFTPIDEAPNTLEAGATLILPGLLNVDPLAALGVIWSAATVHASALDGTPAGAPALVDVAQFTIQDKPQWTVTVSADEDDMGSNVSLQGAGGSQDLSLREAMRLAGASSVGDVIRFDPLRFPVDLPATIAVDPALGPLPTIAVNGTVIDGTNAGVVIDGSATEDFVGLTVAADNVGLRHIIVSHFGGLAERCVWVVNSGAFSAVGLDVSDCRRNSNIGQALKLQDSRDSLVQGCRLGTTNDFTGLALHRCHGAVIRNNTFSNTREGIRMLSGQSHLISGNELSGHLNVAIQTDGTRSSSITHNELHHCASAGRACIELIDSSVDIRVHNNSFAHNALDALHVSTGARRISMQHNTFDESGFPPIRIDTGSNDDLPPPTVQSFDGLSAAGGAGSGDGVVELYSVDAAWVPLGLGKVVAGQWSVQLDEPIARIAGLFTSVDGSTSEFSTIATARGGVLSVTTNLDELDGGDQILMPEQAGGADDLSLREAITIANNRPGADLIEFDTSLFSPGLGTTIVIGSGDAASAPLPEVNDAETVISAAGADVTLAPDTAIMRDIPLLRLTAADSRIEGLRFRGCATSGGHCMFVTGARAQISGNDVRCAGQSVDGIVLSSGSLGSTVRSNVVRDCDHGIDIILPSNHRIASNTVTDCWHAGIRLYNGSGAIFAATLIDNIVRGNLVAGIEINPGGRDISGVSIQGAIVQDNGSTGIRCHRGTYYAEGIDIQFATAAGNGVGVDCNARQLQMRNNIVAFSTTVGIVPPVDDFWSADHNLFFENALDGVTGANAVAGRSAVELDSSTVLADPQFVDLGAGNLTPGPGAIDRGVDTGIDRNGAAAGMYNGAAYDMGAIETP